MKRTNTLTILAVLGLIATFLCGNPSVAYAVCTSPAGVAADIVYNSDTKAFQYCDDTNWIRMNQAPGTGSGPCALAPNDPEGTLSYIVDDRVLQGCAGNVHTAFGPTGGKFGWMQISAGGSYSCGIKSDDTLWCWGTNASGQLGDNTSTTRPTPTPISGGGVWKQISVNQSHSCGIKSDDTLWCWGSNSNGQIGDNTSGTNRLIPTAINGGGTWKHVTAGVLHSCGIKADDTLHCWGTNSSGRTGLNTTTGNTLIPTGVSGGGAWKQASADSGHTCGIKTDDSLHCWGNNGSGRTGLNTSTGNTLVPSAISGGGVWKQVVTGTTYSCGIKSDDTIWCWGLNSSGQLGDGTSGTNRLVPTAISGGGTWKKVSAGSSHTCAIRSDDTLRCWGNNQDGKTFQNTITGLTLAPSAAFEGGIWLDVAAGSDHNCAIRSGGMLHCWGGNGSGQLGVASNIINPLPTPIFGNDTWKSVSSGSRYFACAIKSDDTAWCWGNNGSGQLGNNTTERAYIPVPVSGGATWKQLASGANHTCGIQPDDTLWCWGNNSSGQIGDSTSGTNRLIPTAINGGGTWKAVNAGHSHTCGIKSDNTLWCWGENLNGATGLNTSAGNTLVPTQVSGGGTWNFITVGYHGTCGVKSDGSLWCWGYNFYGQVGDGTSGAGTDRLIPTAVSGGGVWTQVSTHDSLDYQAPHTCGLKSDGSLWCWGYNGQGALGNGGTTLSATPVQIGVTDFWKLVTVNGGSTCGIKIDSSLWCWGYNPYGNLGDGTTTNRLIPTAVVGGGSWESASAGNTFTCAIATNDQLLCWGYNEYGEITNTETSGYVRLNSINPLCSNPQGKAGALVYNSTNNTMQYCDGVGWVRIGK